MSPVTLGMPGVRRTVQDVADRPPTPGLVDRFGRVATDLRVSVTDRCTLRCDYCMPAEGLEWLPPGDVLTDDEIVRLIRVAVERLGVRTVRFTGGEPLLRRGLAEIVAATVALRAPDGERPLTAVTTNGLALRHRAPELAAAGLDRVNVSLDSLDRARFARITRRDRFTDVIDGLAAATAAGLTPVKVNAVLLRGVNDDEAVPLLEWALRAGYELRFIEQMPLDAQGAWDRAAMVTAAEVLAALGTAFRLTPHAPGTRGSAPAETWWAESRTGGPSGPVGVIASVSRPFCGDCDRTRLTADGQLRDCLFAQGETDLRGLLRAGADDDRLAEVWRGAMWRKRAGHGIDDPGFLQPQRPMSAIGG